MITNGEFDTYNRGYTVNAPSDHVFKKIADFTTEERDYLWPIAEVLAMLDGNAFLTEKAIIESYLPEAHYLFESNGGMTGWSSELSWISHGHSENAKLAYENYLTIRKLTT